MSFGSREFYPGNALLFSTSARQVQVSRGSLDSLWGSLGRLSLGSSHLQILLHTLLRMMRMRAAHFLDHLILSNIAILSFSSMALQHLAPMAQFFCVLNLRLFAHHCSTHFVDPCKGAAKLVNDDTAIKTDPAKASLQLLRASTAVASLEAKHNIRKSLHDAKLKIFNQSIDTLHKAERERESASKAVNRVSGLKQERSGPALPRNRG
ncbi:hypothetical protein DdX_15158 [Ditylenchus destructor]|uniref:Uncharacterized protein n=1 Tax=Ditylenchus destructor TaxID=166010 RepID=A0AAD4MSR0_9BILA|nr:hypothetical protein DdX_15158 [Ditylenchus destructor]